MKALQPLLLLLFLLALLMLLPLGYAIEDFSAQALPSISSCPCAAASTTVFLSNTGDTASWYSLSLFGKAAQWVTLVPPRLYLNPEESAEITAYINPIC